MEFTQIIEINVKSLKKKNRNQWGGYVIHDVIVTECDNYPSTKILKYATILDEVINLQVCAILKDDT